MIDRQCQLRVIPRRQIRKILQKFGLVRMLQGWEATYPNRLFASKNGQRLVASSDLVRGVGARHSGTCGSSRTAA
jgi:hypothetical protein